MYRKKKKAFLIDSDVCIVFAKIKNETKRKRKKDLEGRQVMVVRSEERRVGKVCMKIFCVYK